MQRSFGVVRNWKQCRTKYKNLKYDYKTAKSAHAAGGSAAGGPGKYMKFFDEVEAILLDRGLENGTTEMQKRLYDGEVAAGRLQAGHTAQSTASESEVVIEIDDGMYSYCHACSSLMFKALKGEHFFNYLFNFQMTTVMITIWTETYRKQNGEEQVCHIKSPEQFTVYIFISIICFVFLKHSRCPSYGPIRLGPDPRGHGVGHGSELE